MRIRSSQSLARAPRPALAIGVCLATILILCAGSALASYKAEVQQGTLKVIGDAASDKLALRLHPADPSMLDVDVGDNGTADFSFPLASFTAINVQAGRGNDEVRVDDTFGSFAEKALTMNGGPGNDRLFDGDGSDHLQGGDGNDVVVGGRGNDLVNLGTGSDTFTWNPGDSSDTIEGGGETGDTLDFNGANVAEKYDISANGNRVRLTRDVANVIMDLHGISRLDLRALGGADSVTVGDLHGTDLRSVNVDLGAAGGGGDGNADTVTALGTNIADQFHFTRQSGNLVVTGLFERLAVSNAEATDDAVNVDGMDGDDTVTSNVGVSGPAFVGFDGGNGSDTAAFTGSTAADSIGVASGGTAVDTFAPGASTLQTTNVENLSVVGSDGNDAITGANGIASLTHLTLNGGNGDDQLRGGDGNDLILGGAGNDTIDGGPGADVVEMGPGDDTVVWNPGDGSDTVDGQSGSDVFLFEGANIAENVEISANGSRVRFTRDVANVIQDLHGIETADLVMRGGADHVTVDDLTGTGLNNVGVDLSGAPGGGGDGSADTVTVNGTAGPDNVSATTLGASEVVVDGLFARVAIVGSEPANDTLAINTLGGTDSVLVDPSVATLINPVVDLGPQ